MNKELEALNELKNYAEIHAARLDDREGGHVYQNCVEESADIIEQALIQGSNDRTVLHLIFSKKVDLKLVAWASPNVEAYNKSLREAQGFHREPLTKEEFQLICIYGHHLGVPGFDL